MRRMICLEHQGYRSRRRLGSAESRKDRLAGYLPSRMVSGGVVVWCAGGRGGMVAVVGVGLWVGVRVGVYIGVGMSCVYALLGGC